MQDSKQPKQETEMIAEIEIKTEYGKMINEKVNLMPEAQDGCNTVFAHSVQDAVDWLVKHSLFDGAEIERYDGGVVVVTSKWIDFDNAFDALFEPGSNPQHEARYTRQRATIKSCNTIYEQTGYKI